MVSDMLNTVLYYKYSVVEPSSQHVLSTSMQSSSSPCCAVLLGPRSATPNGFPSVDSLVTTFAHELVETATDPTPRNSGYVSVKDGGATVECADLCNFVFTDGAHPETLKDEAQTYEYNLVGVNGLKFLVQTNPHLGSQACALQA